MKTFASKCVTMCILNTFLLMLCGMLAVRDRGGPLFLVTAGICVILCCIVREWFFPGRGEHRLWVSMARAIEVGAVVAFCAWAIMIFLISISGHPDDRFGVRVVFISQGPVVLGAIAGAVARFVIYRKRVKGLPC